MQLNSQNRRQSSWQWQMLILKRLFVQRRSAVSSEEIIVTLSIKSCWSRPISVCWQLYDTVC